MLSYDNTLMSTKSSDITVVVGKDVSAGDRHTLLKARLQIAKAWAKKPHDAWKTWIKEYEIEDISDTEEIRDKVRIGSVFRRVESDLPAIFDDQPDLFFKGKQPQAVSLEPLFAGTYDWLWDFQRLEEKIEDAATYFDLIGMAFVDSPWTTKTKKIKQTENTPVMDENGQPVIDPTTGQPQTQPHEVVYDVPIIDNPQAKVLDPFKVYFSPETIFNTILDYEHCPYYIYEDVLQLDEAREKYKKPDLDSSESLNLNETDISDSVQKLQEYKDDMKRITVYHYYGCLPKDMANDIKDSEGNVVEWSYDKDYHIVFSSNDELKVEECEYSVKPLHILGNYGLANKFWKFGDAKHLMPLVQELQQYRTQILRHTRKMANPKVMVPTDMTVDEKALKNPLTGVVVKYEPGPSGAKVEYLSPSNLGREVEVGVNMVRTDIEQTGGQFSLSQGSGVSQVKTPRGIQTFSEAADKNVRRKRKKIARFIRELIIFQFKQLSMFWKPEDARTIDVIDAGKQQQLPVTQEVLQILGDDNILAKLDIEIESLSVNKVQIKQDALDLFDMAAKYPNVFNLDEMARDLLQNGFEKKDADRYLLTPEQKAKFAQDASQGQNKGANVSVSVKADAATPIGAQILEDEGVLPQGTAQPVVQATQAQDLQTQQLQQVINPTQVTMPNQGGGQ